jgi:hypothetical protein
LVLGCIDILKVLLIFLVQDNADILLAPDLVLAARHNFVFTDRFHEVVLETLVINVTKVLFLHVSFLF